MAEICCGMVGKSGEASPATEPAKTTSSRMARRRRLQIRQFKFVDPPETSGSCSGRSGSFPAGGASALSPKRKKVVEFFPRECENAVEYCGGGSLSASSSEVKEKPEAGENGIGSSNGLVSPPEVVRPNSIVTIHPRYGVASLCGRRRDMEDAVAVHPCFSQDGGAAAAELHYFGVYDGHGCSHVATRCRERLHEIVKEELDGSSSASPSSFSSPSSSLPTSCARWEGAMGRSFRKMDGEVVAWNESVVRANCKCGLQTPECDAVGSTAVVAVVTPSHIVVANCGDSRAVLCRGGKAIPLSSDHKPDRPDELNRIQEAGGRVIYWDGPRVLGVLAMSRAIGDNYLKPYVSCEPEVTIVERCADDECLILASDGLWDVVSNDTACGVARMCLRGKANKFLASSTENSHRGLRGGRDGEEEELDKACWDASMLLTKLALARHSRDNVSVVVVDLRTDT